MKTRHDEMREQCIEFHKAHPLVWELFERFTFDRIRAGFRHYSVYAIFERIRWETDQADVNGQSTWKINNNFRPFYARAFMRYHPEHDGFFRLRHQTSKNRPATGLPPLGPESYPEERLNLTQ